MSLWSLVPAVTEHIPIEDLVPHAKPMLLLDDVLESAENYIVCQAVVRSDGLFDTSGQVSSLLGLEYMAQTVAAFSGLAARRSGMPIKLGFLLGTRRFETNVANFACGTVLTIKVSRVMQGSDGMASFECSVRGQDVSQKARLAVYEPSDPTLFLKGGD
jgi:predicted hotdog family 3-hydroxylacyl-ACP dehydratase